MKVFGNKALRIVFRPKTDEVAVESVKSHLGIFVNCRQQNFGQKT
jgi:hypothetical protein